MIIICATAQVHKSEADPPSVIFVYDSIGTFVLYKGKEQQ